MFLFLQGEQGLPGAAGQDGPPGPLVSSIFFCCQNSRNEIVYKLESLKFCLVNWFINCRVFKEVYYSDQNKKRKIIRTDNLLGKYALIKRSFLSYVHWMKKKKSILNKMPLMAQPVLFQMWTVPLNASVTLSFLALHLKEQHWHRHTVILSPNKLFCS